MPTDRGKGLRALFDVNILIALLDPDHVSHRVATDWYAANMRHGWASCPITENGTARIMSSPGYPNPLPVAEILGRLRGAANASDHAFWHDDISLTNPAVFEQSALLGPKQITDRYLLALAVKNNGRLVTLDLGMGPSGVRGASSANLVQLRG